MKILVTGANGQLGLCLIDHCNQDNSIEIDAYDSSGLDIVDLNSVQSKIRDSAPDYVINAAAYTAVDKAESESEKAYAVNELGAQNLAMTCFELDIPLIHVSTDYVFSGDASLPYKETDQVAPSGVYGASKLAGEKAVEKNCHKYMIVRTAWVFSEYRSNFVKTMLRLAETRSKVSVVCDQIGNPTYAGDIAKALIEICKSRKENWGIYHYVGSTTVSWYEFAKNIFEKAYSIDLIKEPVQVESIATSEYPTDTARPAYSVLDTCRIEKIFDIKPVSLGSSLAKALNPLSNKSN